MQRSRFGGEPIIALLREQTARIATAKICRRHGVSSATFYAWKAQYGGAEVSQARRLEAREDAKARLEKRLAEAMLVVAVLRGVTARMR
jgi:putative transposase